MDDVPHEEAKTGQAEPAVLRVTKEDIEKETRRLEQEVLASQQRSLAALDAAETVGASTLEALAQQNEIIDGVTVNLDAMENDLVYADMILQKIASPFAFLRMKKQAKAFETKFGKTADWSGPLGKKRSFRGFKTFYFVILDGKLMQFEGTGAKLTAAAFETARDTIALKAARIESDRAKREIIVRSGSSKWHLRCADDPDFFSWNTMLNQYASGKRLERKRTAALSSMRGEAANQDSAQPPPAAPASPRAVASLFNQPDGSGPRAQQGHQMQQTQPQTQTLKQTQTQQPNAQASKAQQDFDSLVDSNLDLMMGKIDTLGAMALEVNNAINIQNEKLEQAHESVQARNASLTTLQRKHERRMHT